MISPLFVFNIIVCMENKYKGSSNSTRSITMHTQKDSSLFSLLFTFISAHSMKWEEKKNLFYIFVWWHCCDKHSLLLSLCISSSSSFRAMAHCLYLHTYSRIKKWNLCALKCVQCELLLFSSFDTITYIENWGKERKELRTVESKERKERKKIKNGRSRSIIYGFCCFI